MVDNAAPWRLIDEQPGDRSMRLGVKAAAYGAAGLVLAGAVIFSGSTLGLINSSSSGSLSVLLTDPPSVPTGVSAVYITYSDIAVHAAGFGDSGWVSIPGQGTIDTLGLVNLSRTVSFAQIPALSYNLVRFNISKASVDFMGRNYSVAVNAGRLTVAFVGGLKVNSSAIAAALVDVSPTILNLGNQSSPDFSMVAGARALQIPSHEVRNSMRVVGNETSLEGRGWFQSFRENHSGDLIISGLQLSQGSLSFSAANTGSDPATVRMVIIAQDGGSRQRFGEDLGSIPNSFVFAVGSDGSLQLVSGNPGAIDAQFEGNGYSIAGGTSHAFTYSGQITSVLGKTTVTATTSYDLVLVGDFGLSVQTVVAS